MDKNIRWRVSRKVWSSCPSMPGTFRLLPELSLKSRGLRAESLGPVVLSFGDQVGLVCGQQVALSPQFCRFTVTSCLRCMRELEEGYSGWSPEKVLPRGFSLVSLASCSGLKDGQAESQEPGTVPRTLGQL